MSDRVIHSPRVVAEGEVRARNDIPKGDFSRAVIKGSVGRVARISGDRLKVRLDGDLESFWYDDHDWEELPGQ